MTVDMRQLRAMFRDFKVAADVQKMIEMRRYEQEYIMYGSMFFEDGKRKYIISSKENNILQFLNTRENFAKYPLPMQVHTLLTTVPSGNEEDITRLAKIKLAKIIQESYPVDFLKDFYEIAESENSQLAEGILDELQDRICGVYRKDNLILFEGLMDIAYRRKTITEKARKRYENWLSDEWRQMEDDYQLEDRFSKEMYGFAYRESDDIKVYFNGEKSKAIKKKQDLEKRGVMVSQICTEVFWYNYEKTLKDIKEEFAVYLKKLFDDNYFAYLERIVAVPPAIEEKCFEDFAQKYTNADEQVKQAIEYYSYCWGLR